MIKDLDIVLRNFEFNAKTMVNTYRNDKEKGMFYAMKRSEQMGPYDYRHKDPLLCAQRNMGGICSRYLTEENV